jgi:nucleotide-binding universal stress UspA family protein
LKQVQAIEEIRMVYKRILVPVDGSPTSNAGLNEALRLAKNQGARLRLLHVVDELIVFSTPEAGMNLEPILDSMKRGGKRLLDRAAKLASSRGVRPESELWESAGVRVAEVIVERAKRWRADLVVIGTHGRRGVSRMLMGSDAELVVRNAPMPVLLVRAVARAGKPRGKRKAK